MQGAQYYFGAPCKAAAVFSIKDCISKQTFWAKPDNLIFPLHISGDIIISINAGIDMVMVPGAVRDGKESFQNFLKLFKESVDEVAGLDAALTTTGGTSDARFIRKISPCLEFGLVGKTMHKVDESVSLADLKKLTKIYESILENYFL